VTEMHDRDSRTGGLPLKEALFLGFCAVLILFTRAALRLHLQISGHSMFFTLFFLMLARGCVSYRLSATFVGVLSGLMAMVLGLGKGGLLIPLKFLLPALAVDLAALLVPGLFGSYLLCAFAGAVASSTKFANTVLVDWLVGMDQAVLIQRGLLEAAGAILFGVPASLLIPSVIRRLRAYGVI